MSRNGSIFVSSKKGQSTASVSEDSIEEPPMCSGEILQKDPLGSPCTPTPEEIGRMFDIPDPVPKSRPCSMRADRRPRRSVRELFERARALSVSGTVPHQLKSRKGSTIQKPGTVDTGNFQAMNFDSVDSCRPPVNKNLLRCPNSPDLSSRSSRDDSVLSRPVSPLVIEGATSEKKILHTRKALNNTKNNDDITANDKMSVSGADLNSSIKREAEVAVKCAQKTANNQPSSSVLVGKALLARKKASLIPDA